MPWVRPGWTTLSVETKTLAGVLVSLAVLSVFRAYHYFVTGFVVTDEFGYIFGAMHSQIFVPDRWFFGWLNVAIFRALGVNNIDAFTYLLPFYLFFWSGSTIYLCYRTLKLLDLDGRAISLVLITCVFLPTFTLLSLGFLTESMGLSLAMLGIYFLLLYAKADRSRRRILLALLSSLAFSAATGTREPYVAFSVGGIFLVWFASWRRKERQGTGGRISRYLPLVLFAAPAIFFLQYPSGFLSNTLVPLGESFVKVLFSSLSTDPSHTSTTILNGTLVSPATFGSSSPVRIGNTLGIFFLGLLLGWGPVFLAVSLGGAYVLLSRARHREELSFMLLSLVLLAFVSYLGVSFLVSWDPSYLTFRHYSTLLRFSNTAVPAFVLSAPYFFSRLLRGKRRTLLLVGMLILVTVVSIPSYESFASSNLTYTNGNPFPLSYRTPAAEVRDYFAAHPVQGQTIVLGVPFSWNFTPGVQDLRSVEVVPYPSQSQFLADRWSSFYLYLPTDLIPIETEAPYLLYFAGTNQTHSASFFMLDRQVVLQSQEFILIHVTLKWS